MATGDVCGFFYVEGYANSWSGGRAPQRKYIPQLSLSCHARIVSSVVRSSMKQTFINPSDSAIPELCYTFPLYDGVSVVGFTCTVNKDRVIRGVVQEKHAARQTYDQAVAKGETAGLLEQLPAASDVFLTTVGNIPPNAEIQVDIDYLGELKHDAQLDGIRFTLPTAIAPRYGSYPGELLGRPTNVSEKEGIEIVVDVELPTGSAVKSLQSPSHPISVSIGSLSTSTKDASPSLHLASATLSLRSADLSSDFILQIAAPDLANPAAVLETHPTIPDQRAIMATLVPRFNLPSSRPEIVFVCDRSGSMGGGDKIPNLKSALRLFLKSLPVGVKFNICSFGSHHSYVFPEGSKTYDQSSLDVAMRYVDSFAADFGGTQIAAPVEDTFKRRYKDMDLEVFVLTDGEVWNQQDLFDMVNKNVQDSNGAIRVFTLGVGKDVSHALTEGLARAGNGFSQAVSENEKMETKVIRMLKSSLTPHVRDYSLEVKYGNSNATSEDMIDDDEFELIEKVSDSLCLDVPDVEDPTPPSDKTSPASKPTISLFDPNADPDVDMKDPSSGDRYSHIPTIPAPRILQAPFQIPSLFPYNRTSIYLLLSPGTTQRTPTAVVLRGTSMHGPLELEIPITKLAAPDKTIHQLAARKAAGELEEGRGWIFHAKDKDGKLLKDKYEGRFSDMVEREAVRLGTQFQVSGKWCSFVAVEQDGQSGQKRETRVIDGSQAIQGSSPGSMHQFAPAPAASRRYMMALDSTVHRAPPRARMQGVPAGRVMGSFSAAAAAPSVSFDRFASDDNRASLAMPESMSEKLRSGPRKRKAGNSLISKTKGSAQKAVDAPQDDEESPDLDSLLEGDRLQALVALQTFAGYWAWSEKLLGLLEVDGAVVTAKLQGVGPSCGQDAMATATVISYLRKKLPSEKDAWELLVDKATVWLEGEVGNSANTVIQAAEELFK